MTTQALRSSELNNEPGYSRGVVLSLIAHALFFGFFALKNVLNTDEVIDYKQAIRVDIVGLPEKLKPEDLPKKPEEPVKQEKPVEPVKKEEPIPKVEIEKPKPAPLPVKVEKDTINLEQNKLKQKAALQKLKSLSAIDKIQQELEKEKKAKATKPAVVKGNVISPGTELTGLDKLQNENYESDLDHHVKKQWSLPAILMKKGYKAQVLIHVDDKGSVIRREIIKSSGNPNFDENVLDTVDRANPLPAPPAKLTAKVRVDGIVIEFEE